MDNPAQVFADDTGLPATGAAKQPISWFRFVMQFITVALVFLIASVVPTIPYLVESVMQAMENPGAQPDVTDMGSALVASTVVAGAVGGMVIAWLWLRREGRVREAIRLEPPANWKRTLGWAALGTGATMAIFTIGPMLTEALGLGMPDASFVLDLVTESPALFGLWIVAVAWFAAGFGEEVL